MNISRATKGFALFMIFSGTSLVAMRGGDQVPGILAKPSLNITDRQILKSAANNNRRQI